jgi:diacylglycerol kinase (ATP)
MGGVDLWQNGDENPDNFHPQSIHDKMLEVVSISGTWHLGTLQVSGQSSNNSSLLKL